MKALRRFGAVGLDRSGAALRLKQLARELVFRTVCRHRQGDRPNIMLYCSRRGGSTWVLNTLAAHPGLRYVGRPFLTIHVSRWRHRMPDLTAAAQHDGSHVFRQIVHFEGDAEARFESLARDVIEARIHVYPTLAFRAPYFHRVTNRVVFQMTSGPPLIEWFDERFDVDTVVLFRHPITTSLSVINSGWGHESQDFLLHRWFVDTQLTGAQVDLARGILADGSDLARHVLDWSLKMLVPYRALESGRHPGWLKLTYEQFVTDPESVLVAMSENLALPDIDAMRNQLQRPSRTVTAQTASHVDAPTYLLGRWRKHVDATEERDLMAIPAAFEIDLYEVGTVTARDRHLV
jgi:hypothetical protein